ncbi:MAG: glycosyltransferase [Candidatus Bathyarchaeia archaeon]
MQNKDKTSKLVSIIVTTLNEEKYIGDCLRSLKNQTYANKEIIVVDSNSKDKTADIAKEYADRIIFKDCIIPEGRNLGAREAQGDVFLFVDADITLSPNWISTVLPHLNNGTIVAVYGDLLPKERALKAWLAYSKEELSNLVLRNAKTPCFGKLGTAVAIKRAAFEKVGGFNEKNACCDDVDMSLKLRDYGKIKFVRDAKGYVSMRRFEKNGYLKLSLLWFIVGSYYILTRKTLLSSYSRDYP